MSDTRYMVTSQDALEGKLPNGAGCFRILIDEPTCGAKQMSLLTNRNFAGVAGREHVHDVEHFFYILSGSGTLTIEGEAYRLAPHAAVFVPPGARHAISADETGDLEYLVMYAPAGAEQKLKAQQEDAFR